MKIAAMYSFNQGQAIVEAQFPAELAEVMAALAHVDAASARTKQSQEVTMPGRMLYSPVALNRAILTDRLYQQGWTKPRALYETTIPETGETYKGYIEGDGVKNGLGLEVQFGKYAFLGWDVFGKMPIFARLNVFTAGVEVTPMRSFVRGRMSTGIGCFEQLKAMMEYRGVSNVDIPILVLGVAPDHSDQGEAGLADEDLPPDVE